MVLLGLLTAMVLACAPPAVAAPTFTTSNYNAPTVTSDASGTLLSVANPPGGLYYRATLDAARAYRVTVTGQRIDASFKMRLRRGTGGYDYRPAPDGASESFVVSNAASVEVLFYSNQSGSYRIRSVTLDDCTGTCKTNSDLRSKVLTETPGLQQALDAGDQWQAAKLIRHWAAPKIDWGGNPDLLNPVGYDAAQMYYEFFAPNVTGVYCGGAADFLKKLLALFQIQSFTVDFGDLRNSLTHVTVVVPFQNSDGTTDYRVDDPTFDMDVSISPSGKPASWPVLWEMWRAGMTNRVQLNSQSLDERRIFLSPPSAPVRCGDVGQVNGACGFSQYTAENESAYRADGYQIGLDGFIQLLGTTTLFNVDAGGVAQAVAQDFITKHDTFKQAVLTGDTSTTVAPLPLPPSNTNAPAIQGQPVTVGQTLTTTDGTWTSNPAVDATRYQWQRCDANGAGCADISGATSNAYTPVAADAGQRIAVEVYAHNENGWSDAAVATTASPTATVQKPENITAPNMSGTAADGSLLQLDDGGYWQGTQPFDWSFQWLSCDTNGGNCRPIPGATSYRYQLTSAEIGKRVVGRVIASNPAGAGTADSSPSAVVTAAAPGVRIAPSLSGRGIDGTELTLSNGDWSGTAPINFAYQWTRCDSAGSNCQDISGATASWRMLTASDVGSRLKVRVVASNIAGATLTETALSAVIGAAPPKAAQAPNISGTAADGSFIQLDDAGGWTGTKPFTETYQWVRCDADGSNCQDIAGSTSYRRLLTSADVGKRVKGRVIMTNSGGSGGNDSALSAVVAAIPPKNDAVPTISGVMTDGEALTLSKGNWSGTTPQTYAYQWQACAADGTNCQDTAGASSSYRRITSAEVGKRLRVRVTATNSAGSVIAFTGLTAVVAAAPPLNSAPPLFSGTATQGQFLTLTTAGSWSGTRPFTESYQWIRCNSDGTGCQDIVGSTAYRRQLTGADVGKRLKARVTEKNSVGSASAESALSAVVQ